MTKNTHSVLGFIVALVVVQILIFIFDISISYRQNFKDTISTNTVAMAYEDGFNKGVDCGLNAMTQMVEENISLTNIVEIKKRALLMRQKMEENFVEKKD